MTTNLLPAAFSAGVVTGASVVVFVEFLLLAVWR